MRNPDPNGVCVSIVIVTHNGKHGVLRCLDSTYRIIYKPIEIIIVDNGSTDGTVDAIRAKYPEVQIIVNEMNLLLATARQIGVMAAKGEYVFLVDFDNVLDPEVVGELAGCLSSQPQAGMAGPVAYYLSNPDRIWSAGSNISLRTSLAHHLSFRDLQKTEGQFHEVLCFPNAFMVRRNLVLNIGGINTDQYPQSWSEADLGMRIRHAGYRSYTVESASVYHDIPEPGTGLKGLLRRLHFEGVGQTSRVKAFEHGRNRTLFMRQYAGNNYWLYLVIFYPLIFAYYAFLCLANFRFDLLYYFMKGSVQGLLSAHSRRL